ncbi:hypothetical protein L0663_05250 [Dyadobacter sp. CY107]|nr:hypothetical protein [Dyadobacter fanqingshengii]MCF2502774.1 hypothetical protein [Dyadobacter fanqingshengii]
MTDLRSVQSELDALNNHLAQFGEFDMTQEEISLFEKEQQSIVTTA